MWQGYPLLKMHSPEKFLVHCLNVKVKVAATRNCESFLSVMLSALLDIIPATKKLPARVISNESPKIQFNSPGSPWLAFYGVK